MTERRPPPRLIVNADDLGLCAEVNAGILRAHREGIVTAASLLATGRGFEDAVLRLHAAPRLDVGVHLAFVAEPALSGAGNTLTCPGGRLPPSAGAFARRWLAGRIRGEDLETEARLQIERIRAAGLRPSHLDSHQHVHLLPGVFERILDLAARFGIETVRLPAERLPRRGVPAARLFRLPGLLALRVLCARARRLPRPPAAPRFAGFLDGGCLTEERLIALLSGLEGGTTTELMCHPGLSPSMPEVAAWGYRHEEELRALTSARVRALVARRGIRLCGFRGGDGSAAAGEDQVMAHPVEGR
ncbi:MAG: ChbG/HpnK family deacetylase [Desulfobacterales bacterium]